MARAAKATDSVVDGLKQVYTDIAGLKLLPDAGQHMEVIDKLSQAVLAIIQQVTQAKAQQAAQMQAQVRQQAMNPMMGGQAGPRMGGGLPPGAPGGPPSQGPVGMPANAMPDPDEMRRMLQSQGAGG